MPKDALQSVLVRQGVCPAGKGLAPGQAGKVLGLPPAPELPPALTPPLPGTPPEPTPPLPLEPPLPGEPPVDARPPEPEIPPDPERPPVAGLPPAAEPLVVPASMPAAPPVPPAPPLLKSLPLQAARVKHEPVHTRAASRMSGLRARFIRCSVTCTTRDRYASRGAGEGSIARGPRAATRAGSRWP